MTSSNLIVGITGASGVIYGIRLLEALSEIDNVSSGLILSPSADQNIAIETDYSVAAVRDMADVVYDHANIAAAPSSGSFLTKGMVVTPCSIRTLSDIANCHSENLLARAADVTLKEGRKLVLVPRETPLNRGHIRLMGQAAEMGAVILPPFPAFYHRPNSINDIVDHTVGKILDQFGIGHDLFRRWSGE